ncbi:MAG: epoxide hydrolase [Deltaproteobacteria bacterium]|nr:epoxide hydrolase [Deltaproteobacteria bacterium]MBW2498129.1 epoxide hydrolase [Deltaproteobacteria bacterium]
MKPFRIEVPEETLEDLRSRLARTRWPDALDGAGWDYGTDLDYARELASYWQDAFDWRRQESLLNRLPQYRSEIDGLGIHFVHVKGKGPAPMPIVLTHGWPSSFFEMHKVIGPLSDPAAHGGDPADAFDVVVPSLPGYGFSDRPTERGLDTSRIADLWVRLMTETLGYERFGAQGGDWGAAVNTGLAVRHPERLIGVHYNMLAPPIDEAKLTPDQRRWWEEVKAYRAREWGYVHLQSTKPQSLAFGLNDSPAGLAAWIVEKWRRWSDCDGDLERVYTKDELLTNVTIYWVTQTIGSSLRLYFESFGNAPVPPVYPRTEVPTGVAAFKEVNRPPRELCEPWHDLRRFSVMDRGGHFPAMENPEGLVSEIRAFFRALR